MNKLQNKNKTRYIPSRLVVIVEEDDGRTYKSYRISKAVNSDEFSLKLIKKLQWTELDGNGTRGDVEDLSISDFTLSDLFNGRKVKHFFERSKADREPLSADDL